MSLPRDGGGAGLREARAAHPAPKRLPARHPFTLPSTFHTEAQRPVPTRAPVTQRVMHAAKGPPVANPGPYNTAHHFSSFGSLVEALKRDRKPGSARRVMRKPKSVPLIGMGFPFADERQVAFANAAGDIRRNILPRASALLGGAPPRIHAGASVDKSDRSPQRRAGYAWRGRNDIYLTPDAYMDVPNFARGVALHELAHTRQDPREPSRTKVEGGADWMAEQLAAKLGLSRYEPGYPDLIERYSEELGLPRARPEIRRMLEPLRARLH